MLPFKGIRSIPEPLSSRRGGSARRLTTFHPLKRSGVDYCVSLKCADKTRPRLPLDILSWRDTINTATNIPNANKASDAILAQAAPRQEYKGMIHRLMSTLNMETAT